MSWKQANNTFFTNVDVKWCGSRSRSAFFWFSRSRSRNLKLSKMLIVINKSKFFLLNYIRLKTSILKNYESLWLATVQYQSKETLPWENYTYFAVWDVALGINNGPPTDFTEPCTFKMAHSLYKMLHIYCKSSITDFFIEKKFKKISCLSGSVLIVKFDRTVLIQSGARPATVLGHVVDKYILIYCTLFSYL